MDVPNPSNRFHNFQILVGTIAGLVSILGGVLSIKSGFFSQGEIYGQLQGVVRDEALAKPLVLATVQIFNQQDEVVSTLSTNDEGAYALADVKEGSYLLKALAPLHRTEEKKVTVEKKRVTTVDFYLVPDESDQFSGNTFSGNTFVPVSNLPPAPVPVYRRVDPPIAREIPEELPPSRYNEPAPYYNEYDSSQTAPIDEGVRRRPPTTSETLVKAGALLLDQYLNKKNQKSTDQTLR